MENKEKIENTEFPAKKQKSFFGEIIDTLLIILVFLLPIRFFIAQPFIVVGDSMYPTFKSGDYLIVDEISYRFEAPKRGEVIIFRPPINPKNHYIKRIIGLPGETIIIKNSEVKIINRENPNGFILEEKYTSSERDAEIAITLSEDEYFVMGDNRAVSSDSRVWGPLKKENITGRSLVRLYPLNSIDIFPGKIQLSL